MEPSRSPQTTLNDLLDRILDKGILLNTDLIICVAGIPLLGVNLKLALAGMETMLEYGIMKDWDEAQRAVTAKGIEVKKPSLRKNEHIIFSMFGTHWYSKGIYNNWRAGTIYITNMRLIMFRKIPYEVLLDVYYEEIRAMVLQERDHFTGDKRQELYLLLKDDEIVRVHTKDTVLLKKTIEDIMKEKGLKLEKNSSFSDEKEICGELLQEGEEVTHKEKMYHQVAFVSDGITRYQWKPGHLYLTNKRLCWWYDFDKKLLFDVPSDNLIHVTIQKVQFGNAQVQEKSLIVSYKDKIENKAACFFGNEDSLIEWEKVIGAVTREHEEKKSMETCPKCSRKTDRESLLENGCSWCGWVSYRKKY